MIQVLNREPIGDDSHAEFAKNFPYRWIAHFKDGSALFQFPPQTAIQNKFDDLWVRKDDIDYLEISGLRYPVVINFPDGADPIIFERVRRDSDTAGNVVHAHWNYFGYKVLIEGRSQKVLFVIHRPTGILSIEFDDSKTRG